MNDYCESDKIIALYNASYYNMCIAVYFVVTILYIMVYM